MKLEMAIRRPKLAAILNFDSAAPKSVSSTDLTEFKLETPTATAFPKYVLDVRAVEQTVSRSSSCKLESQAFDVEQLDPARGSNLPSTTDRFLLVRDVQPPTSLSVLAVNKLVVVRS